MLLRYSLLALTLAACGGATAPSYGGNNPPPGGGGGGGGSSASVTVANTAYSPASIAVKVGTTVTWTNDDAVGHTVTSDAAGVFNGSLSGGSMDPYNPMPGGTFSYTFSATGSFPYHCNVHPTLMHGTVTVNP